MLKKLFNILFIYPLSQVWGLVYSVRRFAYGHGILKSYEFEVPVISIGNLAFGGSGKTPFTRWLAKWFSSRGQRVLIVTRGYKSQLENSSGMVVAGKKVGFDPNLYGDEPLMLLKGQENCFVLIGKNRVQNLKDYCDKIRPDIVLLDDGFQHLKLHRDLNLVLFDSRLSLDSYYPAPRGYFREGISALIDADAVVLTRVEQVDDSKVLDIKERITPKLQGTIPFMEVCYRPTGLYDVYNRQQFNLEEMKGMKVIAVSGIASPSSFLDTLESCGVEVVESCIFPDHHAYQEKDFESMCQLAKVNNAQIVTTEKDMVKIRRFASGRSFLYLEIELEIKTGLEELVKSISRVVRMPL